MILDLNKIKLNKSIDDGALSVVEQIPGLVEWADQTHKLRLGKLCKICQSVITIFSEIPGFYYPRSDLCFLCLS